LPIRALRLGRKLIVTRADLMAALGIPETPPSQAAAVDDGQTPPRQSAHVYKEGEQGRRAVNRKYIHRGRVVPGVYQRCGKACPTNGCKVDHSWWYLVELRDQVAGKRRQETKGGFPTGADAAAAREEVLRKHREGTLPPDSKLTLASCTGSRCSAT
jgi:hypothetical protein